jgi:hypothetical protein
VGDQRFDPDLLDEEDPFEIDAQAAHLFKHPQLAATRRRLASLPSTGEIDERHAYDT